jgi:hypothetical protein
MCPARQDEGIGVGAQAFETLGRDWCTNCVGRSPCCTPLSRRWQVVVVDNEECKTLMSDFIAAEPALWAEDIGETAS